MEGGIPAKHTIRPFRKMVNEILRDRNTDVDFRGQSHSHETYEFRTDRDARLYKNSKVSESKLVYLGHVLKENRKGLTIDIGVTLVDCMAERDAAKTMSGRRSGRKRRMLGGDKGYDDGGFAKELGEMTIKQRSGKSVAGRTTRNEGYAVAKGNGNASKKSSVMQGR